MPRPKGDHEGRRIEVAEAVWRVLATSGFAGLTMRAVAAQLSATTGVLTHYFTDKHQLTSYALEMLDQRSAARSHTTVEPGISALRAAMLNMLPLGGESTVTNRVWVGSWDAALADPQWTAAHAARYAASRDRLEALVRAAQQLGQLGRGDPEQIAVTAQSFVLGLVVQAILDPPHFPPARQAHLLDMFLTTLTDAPSDPQAPH